MKWPFDKSNDDEDVDVDTYMKEITMGSGKIPEEDNYAYLKSIKLSSEEDVEKITKEIVKGNLIVVNIRKIFPDKARIRNIVRKIKTIVGETGGDMCRVSNEKLLIVPEGMEIVG